MSGGRVADALEQTVRVERQQALRALLRSPVLRPDHAAFPLVRRHASVLRDWLQAETGWWLRVDPTVARLHKTPPDDDDATRPARAKASSSTVAFTRRRYVVLCLALAALERGEAQTTLGRLADHVLAGLSDPALERAGVRLDLRQRGDRGDLVAVVRLLLSLGVLHRVAGDEEGYAGGSGDALYDVDRHVLSGLLVARRGPSAVDARRLDERLAALRAEEPPRTDDARTRALRHRLTRRLLDDPVIYLDDLDDDERAYWTGQRRALVDRVTEATGLLPEVRAEGVAMVDPTFDVLSDVRMPEDGTEGHVTLLLAAHLADAQEAVAVPALEQHVGRLAVSHGRLWRQSAREPGAERALVATAVERLRALRLVAVEPSDDGARGGHVRPLPALARYAVAEPQVLGSPTTGTVPTAGGRT